MIRNFRFLNNLTLLMVFVFTLFVVGCNKLDDGVIPNSMGDENLKSGKAIKKGELTIVEIALNLAGDLTDPDGQFNELVKALLYVDGELGTGLVGTLNGTDQFTVFAPTDAAFEALYSALEVGGIDELPAELVRDVLLYHVTDGRRASNSVVPKKNVRTIETLLGVTFTVDTTPMITAVGNTANFVEMDGALFINVSASNGIIHVIDAVILPIVP
ncbi:fasciclin domain-containing protein [Sunxiuqinia sp. sy24]|uniref:fasciclin domain-containing protein n=1 Tax=Sunxiuqinia sp. sy24 TaxID=3461495 RepID=UPI00404626AD